MTARSDESRKSPLQAWVRALELTAPIDRREAPALPVLIEALAERFGDAPALSDRVTSLSYRELADSVNRYARWARKQTLVPSDVVCLFMPNCPDYLAIWLGLTRAGVIVALLNTNLTGTALAHSINIVSPRYVIVAGALWPAARTAREQVPESVRFWIHGGESSALPRIDTEVTRLAPTQLTADEWPAPRLDDRALYIYTSGTTGLPKAANVSHLRVMQWSHWFAGLMDTQPSDRMYDCLPLYHSVGGVVATGAVLVRGGTVVLREKFSAREFWDDIVLERCTLFQYIGELCRYLLAQTPRPQETRHTLRLCCGNGMRPEVWEPFRQRFRIPQVLEYYAATEGSFSLYNCEGKPGAIGRIPPFLAHRMPVALVKFDETAGVPARDAAGWCLRCGVDEVGEAIGQISGADGKHGGRFEGYADTAASEKKILRNVFTAGDAWYRTGDLMRKDAQGYFYFVDRVGDTYRWKGENVSTGEVTAAVTACAGVNDAVVYGVTVPGTEGRAGMAALVVEPEFDLAGFRRELTERLPDYARPVFVRLVPALELTGTFKLRKQDLALEGYDLSRVRDALYVEDRQAQAYVALDEGVHARLLAGKLRL
jgi:fatty-acyl-CoA synthase